MSVNTLINDFGKKLVTDLRSSLNSKVNFVGGGDSKLSGKIRYNIRTTANGIVFELIMPGYGKILNDGRAPGHGPNKGGNGKVSKKGQEGIGVWGQRKGYIKSFINKDLERRKKLQAEAKDRNNLRKYKTLKPLTFQKGTDAFAFVVSRTLKEKGYEGNQFIDEVLDDGRLDLIKVAIASELKRNVIVEIQRN